LNQLAVLPPEALRALTTVTQLRILIDASAPIQTWALQALILVCTAFSIRSYDPTLSTAACSHEQCYVGKPQHFTHIPKANILIRNVLRLVVY